jgi:hypothetical protein
MRERPRVAMRQQQLEADARTRTGDPFITSVDQPSSPVAPSRAKLHESKKPSLLRWRPKTPNDNRVDPW